jgi:hypothetical protein
MRTNYYIITFMLFMLVNIEQANAQRRIQQIDPQQSTQNKPANKLENDNWKDKLLYGGNAFATFWGGTGFLMLQPQVAYAHNSRLMTGAGVTYIYWSSTIVFRNSNIPPIKISDNVVGLNFFARLRTLGPLFVHTEYMPINFTSNNNLGETKRLWGQSMFVGGGYSNSMDGRGTYIMVLYDMLWRDPFTLPLNQFNRSFYRSPYDIRIGLFF